MNYSVGDGTYLFSQMESVYWIARRYDIPFLLIVLNNGGWNAPKVSALLVHKDGLSSKSNRRGKWDNFFWLVMNQELRKFNIRSQYLVRALSGLPRHCNGSWQCMGCDGHAAERS